MSPYLLAESSVSNLVSGTRRHPDFVLARVAIAYCLFSDIISSFNWALVAANILRASVLSLAADALANVAKSPFLTAARRSVPEIPFLRAPDDTTLKFLNG